MTESTGAATPEADLPTAIRISLVLRRFVGFSGRWGSFFILPLIVITNQDLATPPLGILFFRNQEAGEDFGALMAAAVIIIAPLVMIFLLTQRRFVEGIALSTLKN